MDSDQKIREFLNNEDTKEIVNFLFDLPTPAFKFWGGLIKQSYKSKILEGSGVLEALKIEEEQKELRKEAAILALLYTNYNVILPKIEIFTRSKQLGRSVVIFGVLIFN